MPKEKKQGVLPWASAGGGGGSGGGGGAASSGGKHSSTPSSSKHAAKRSKQANRLMKIQQDGPPSRNGKRMGLTIEWVLHMAYKIWCSKDIRRKAHVKSVLETGPELGGLKPYEKFGQSPNLAGEAASRIDEAARRAQVAKEMKGQIAEVTAGAAADKLKVFICPAAAQPEKVASDGRDGGVASERPAAATTTDATAPGSEVAAMEVGADGAAAL